MLSTPMLSAILLVDASLGRLDDADRVRAIVKTLGALVRLVVADVVADATVVSTPDAALNGLEDRAGCRIAEDADLGKAFTTALIGLRRDTVFVLQPGFAPDAGFIGEVEQLMERPSPPHIALLAAPKTLAQRLLPALAPAVGVIAPRAAFGAYAKPSMSMLRKTLTKETMRSRAVLL